MPPSGWETRFQSTKNGGERRSDLNKRACLGLLKVLELVFFSVFSQVQLDIYDDFKKDKDQQHAYRLTYRR